MKLKSMQKVLRGFALVGQLGFTVITPPLVFVLLASYLSGRFGWGAWVMVIGILLGILTAAASTVSFLRGILRQDAREHPPAENVSFLDHT